MNFPPLLRRNDLRDPPKWVNEFDAKNIWANKIWRNLNWQGFTRITKDRGPIKYGLKIKKNIFIFILNTLYSTREKNVRYHNGKFSLTASRNSGVVICEKPIFTKGKRRTELTSTLSG